MTTKHITRQMILTSRRFRDMGKLGLRKYPFSFTSVGVLTMNTDLDIA